MQKLLDASSSLFEYIMGSLLAYILRFAPPSRWIASFWHFAQGLMKKPEAQLVRFSNSNFKSLPSDQTTEEEAHDAISESRYYPVRIGDVLNNKYQVVGKLGYGLGSTVWLANEFQ